MAQAPAWLLCLLEFFFCLLYGRLAWAYDLVAYLVSLGRWQKWVMHSLPYIQGQRVLELGHGPGHLLRALSRRGVRAIGLDRSFNMAQLARRRTRRLDAPPLILNADASFIPLKSHSVECIVATFPTAYIFAAATLREIDRLLTDEGVLVLLPVAWLTGKSPWERLLAWAFRYTGESDFFTERVEQPLKAMGFIVQVQFVEDATGRVMLITAHR